MELSYRTATLAGRIVDPGDVRQLTVYGELARKSKRFDTPPHLMLLYPFMGELSECVSDCCSAWNGSKFWLTPVYVRPLDRLAEAIQPLENTAL